MAHTSSALGVFDPWEESAEGPGSTRAKACQRLC